MILSALSALSFADHRLYRTTTTIVPQIITTGTSDKVHRFITIVRESWVPLSSTSPWFFRPERHRKHVMTFLCSVSHSQWDIDVVSRVISFRPFFAQWRRKKRRHGKLTGADEVAYKKRGRAQARTPPPWPLPHAPSNRMKNSARFVKYFRRYNEKGGVVLNPKPKLVAIIFVMTYLCNYLLKIDFDRYILIFQ